ncbi:class I SAM-dependent methyltransferase [Effusibacillus consociatus]|uniref:Class I SAM-dependent methyltransferase n=1 Tax=Effusibacillus consociatus TaxID=1117041 RepID=A0ABV9Q1A9_9BACL
MTDPFSLHDGRVNIRKITEEIRRHRQALNEMTITLEKLMAQNAKLSDENSRLQVTIAQIQNMLDRQNKKLEINYFDFQMKYRGARDEIKKRQSIYLDYFAGKTNVLDLGCGRGEFIELLIDNNVSATGVDLDQEMVTFCKEQGLPVVLADIFEYLEGVPDQSVGGVFLGQVIEHLSAARFVELVKLCHRKLTPGAYFIAETPNPECVLIFAHSFYIDLTHVKPIHSLAAQFVLESNDFKDVKVVYSSPLPDEYHLPKDIESSGLNSKTVAVLEKWNRVLFGCQDYAIIGRK